MTTTTTIEPTTRVRDVAVASHRALDLLERWHVDYFCHGDDTLGHACAVAGISVRDVISALAAEGAVAAPADALEPLEPLEPLDVETGSSAKRPIGDVVDVVASTYAPRASEACRRAMAEARGWAEAGYETGRIEVTLGALERALRLHLSTARDDVYPQIRQLELARLGRGPWPDPALGPLGEQTARLRRDYDLVHALLRRLRERAASIVAMSTRAPDARDVRASLDALEKAIHLYFHVEGNVLLARAATLEATSLT